MNLKTLLIACAALMAGFTSCSNDAEPDNTGVLPNGKPTVAKITLTQQAKGTRAASAGVTDSEAKINKANLYIFNASKSLVKQVDFDIAGDPATATKTVELTTGIHYFYALVNHPGTAPVFNTDATLAAVISDLGNELALTSLSTITGNTTGFLMSSMGDPVEVNLEEATESESQADTKNSVTLEVGRAMAKLVADFNLTDPVNDQPLTGTLGNVQYQAANNPNKMYLLPNYVIDQIWTPYYDVQTIVQTNYFPQLPNDLSTSMSGWVTADGNNDNAIYMVENSNENPREGNSTFVLLKGVFTPAADYCFDGSTGERLSSAISTGESFWCAVATDGTINKQRFFDSEPQAAALTKLSEDLGGTYTGSVEYRNGEAYYSFYLQNSGEATREGKYTTARNSYYDVTITSVNELGANTPSGVIPDVDTPLGAEAWIKGTIEVLDWNVITQSGGI